MARPHPHHFAYLMLPQLVGRRPAAVRRELADPLLARELLLYMWDKAAESLAPRERVSPRGLHLSWHQVASRPTALLQLPAPQATGEAHLVAIVYEGPAASPDNQPTSPSRATSCSKLPWAAAPRTPARPPCSASCAASSTATTRRGPQPAGPIRPAASCRPWPNCSAHCPM
jgi:hypothetical protein